MAGLTLFLVVAAGLRYLEEHIHQQTENPGTLGRTTRVLKFCSGRKSSQTDYIVYSKGILVTKFFNFGSVGFGREGFSFIVLEVAVIVFVTIGLIR